MADIDQKAQALSDARARILKLQEQMEEEASAAKMPVTVTVIDVHGNSVLQHRMNGAIAFSMLISHRKAYTAALTQKRTSDLFDLVQPGKELFHLMSQDSFCAMGGGAPLVHDGVVVGGLGISGGTVAQDIGILEAALQPRRH
ncbi:heme-binding protein [Rhizobium leguminosarum]|uniref:GlcG/HbpS family heme-binding protein n=1 Tax=Rhizobium leguminosarum TaxID=384 RepID=UPI003F99FF6E